MEPPNRGDELAAGDAERAARPGRRRLGWAAVALAVGAALLLGRPDLSLHGQRPEPGDGVPAGDAAPDVAWGTRGDLRHSSFVGEAARRIRHDRPGPSRVLFAGRLPDGSRLALGGTDVVRGTVATAVHALLVPPLTDPGDAVVTDVAPLIDPQQVVAWAGRGVDGHVYAVLLSRPGPARFEVSGRVEHDGGGVPGRQWVTVSSGEGSALVDLGTDTDPVVAVRATAVGVLATPALARVAGTGETGPVRVDGVGAAGYLGPRPALLVLGLRQSLGGLVDLTEVRPRVLWSGAPWGGRRLALVLVTRPDGVRLQTVVGEQAGDAFGAGVRALPADDPDGVPWLLEPFTAQDPTFLLCPTGAGTLVYRRPGREVRLTVRESGAVAVVDPGPLAPSARGAGITLLAPGGRPLLSTTLATAGGEDPLALRTG